MGKWMAMLKNQWERIFLVINFLLEIPSAVFDQLSSVNNPNYALVNMILSLVVCFVGVFDLARTGRRERVRWVCRRGQIPWFYSSNPPHKPLGTMVDIIGLVCGILQFISATITYVFHYRGIDVPFKISVWPLIFAFVVLCSRFPKTNAPTQPEFEIHPLPVASGSSSQSENNPTEHTVHIHDPLLGPEHHNSTDSSSHSPVSSGSPSSSYSEDLYM